MKCNEKEEKMLTSAILKQQLNLKNNRQTAATNVKRFASSL